MPTNTSTLAYRENAPVDAHGAVSPRAFVGRVTTSSTNAGAIDPTSDLVLLNSAGAETRTLAAGVPGQRIVLYAVTAAGAIGITLTGNPAASDLVTIDAAGDRVELIYISTTVGWVALTNNAVTFS